jgi:methionyl-tRNA formyltransferase
MKVYRTEYHLAAQSHPAGTLLTDGKSHLTIVLADGQLELREVQVAGKKRMAVEDFLRGTHLDGWRVK